MAAVELRAGKTDHRPYIEAVRAALLAEDINISVAMFSTRAVRAATMPLIPPEDESDETWHHTFVGAERFELRWTEEDGWFLLALHASGDRRLPTIWRCGFGGVLPSAEIRTWLAVLLAMPGISPSQEDGPYRSHQTHDPAFESSLAFYAL